MGFLLFQEGEQITPFYPPNWRQVERTEKTSKSSPFQDSEETFGEMAPSTPSPSDTAPISPQNPYVSKTLYHSPSPITAEQIMSHPVMALTADEPASRAIEILGRYHFRHIPIITGEKKIMGLISHRTLQREMLRIDQGKLLNEQPRYAIDLMDPRVICAEGETDIGQIAQVFVEEKLGAVPIVSKEGKLKGIVTRSDILRTLVQVAPIEQRG